MKDLTISVVGIFSVLMVLSFVVAVGGLISLECKKALSRRKISRALAKANEKRLEVLTKAKTIGPLFRANNLAGVVAVCTEKDFSLAYQDYVKEVKEGKRQATDKVVLRVAPTFTFWQKSESQTMVHTGSSEDGEALIISLAERALNIKKYEVDNWDDIMKILVVRDGRLFVPFAGGMPELKEQVKFYKHESLDYAVLYLRNSFKEAL